MRVLVVGAGPVGVEAALAAVERGHTVALVESGFHAGSNVRRLAHRTLFASWADCTSAAGRARTGLEAQIGAASLGGAPTGEEYLDAYLEPLAESLAGDLELLLETDVLALGRGVVPAHRLAPTDSASRTNASFRAYVESADGERYLEADIVIDATGASDAPNFLGPGGLPALGEAEHDDRIVRSIPDIEGGDEEDFAGLTTLVVGDGHAAASTLDALLSVRANYAGTRIIWVTACAGRPFAGEVTPASPEQARLERLANEVAAGGEEIQRFAAHAVERIADRADGRLDVTLTDGSHTTTVEVDTIVANVGARPGLALTDGLEVDFAWPSLGVAPRSGDARARLAHPETGYFAVGARAHGRARGFDLRAAIADARALIESL